MKSLLKLGDAVKYIYTFRKSIYHSYRLTLYKASGFLFRHNNLISPKLVSNTNKMSSETIQNLEKERQTYEARIGELVEKLESYKKEGDIKVPKEAIIRSKEEREASQAIEQLAISEETKQAEVCGKKQQASEANKKVPQQKGPKQQRGGAKEPPPPEKPIDVSRLDLRIGKILEVERHPDADALYVEKIDCGDSTGPRTIISGLVKHVPIEEMKDRNVVVLCNLKPVKMRGILSEGMVMCASSEEKVEILQTPANVKPGDKVIFDNYPGEPDEQLNPKKKIWEQVAPDIKTNADGVAMYKECEFKVSGLDEKFKSNLKNVQIR